MAALVVLGAGAAARVRLHAAGRRARTCTARPRSSSARTRLLPRSSPRNPIRWPTFGFDVGAPALGRGARLEPPFRAVWTYKAKKLIEFPPALGYRRLFVQTNDGRVRLARPPLRDGALEQAVPPLLGGLADAVRLHRVRGVPEHAAVQRDRRQPERLARRAARARRQGALAASRSARARPRRSWSTGASTSATGAATSTRSTSTPAKLLWTYTTGGAVKGALAYSSGTVFFGSYDHHVYAVNAKTGKLVWKASAQERLGPQGTFYSTPAVAYGRVYIGSTDGKVYSYGATTGKLRWSHGHRQLRLRVAGRLAGRVLIGSHDKHFYALDAATGDEVWKFDAGAKISGPRPSSTESSTSRRWGRGRSRSTPRPASCSGRTTTASTPA